MVRADELRSALASSVLAPSTLVWREGMSGWVPAFTVPELGASEGGAPAIAEPSTDGTTDVSVRPPVEPPAMVRPSRVMPNVAEPGSTADTGRPTPTELLPDGSKAARGANGAAARPAAGRDTAGAPMKIGAAPRPVLTRVQQGKLESSTSSKVNVPRPATASGWRKPELVKKSDDELTLVAEGGDPFKVKPGGDSASNSASGGAKIPAAPAVPAKVQLRAPPAGSRRPVTHTAVLPANEPAKPPFAAKMPSTVPPPPVPVGPRRAGGSVPPAPVPAARRSPSGPPGAGAGARQGRGSGPPGAPRGGASVSVPSAPRIPSAPVKPAFSIVDNTSTDSTGVLPLGGKYAAEPTAERPPAPSFVDGAPGFAERTPSFPDAGRPLVSAADLGDETQPPPADRSRAPMRSQPPPADLVRPPLRSQPEAQAYAAPGPQAMGYGPGVMPSSAVTSYPPVPRAMLLDARASAARLEAEARAGAMVAGRMMTPPPYSAPPPPLALAEPSIGEIRATGALPLVNPKRSYPPVAGIAEADVDEAERAERRERIERTDRVETPAPPDPLADAFPPPPTKVGDPVIVPMSSLFGAGGVLIAMAIMAFFVGRCSMAPSASAAPARAALAALPRLARAGMPPVPKPCWMAKQPVRWAPSVLQSVPVDVTPTASGVVVAYARDAREPATVTVDFAAGTFDETPGDKREDDLVRVFAPRDGSGLLSTTKADTGPLVPYIYAPGASPFVIGVVGRGTPDSIVAFAERPDATPATLWPVPPVEDDKGLEAARVLALGPASHALVFRRSGSILGGFLGEGHKAQGGLGVVAGSGGSVGKPALGTNQREIAVVFADKAKGDTPWEIRVGHAPLGEMPRETIVVPLPKGGPGGDAFAPDVAGTPDGRWVLVWTEGKTGAYAVRAQTFGADWKALGDPIAISPPAGNFGQAIVGVAGNYVTTMFLSRGTSGSYELWGAVLQCGS